MASSKKTTSVPKKAPAILKGTAAPAKAAETAPTKAADAPAKAADAAPPRRRMRAKAADAAPAKAEGGETGAAAPKNYSRGEGQKPVTQAYKDNWNAIFGKTRRRKSDSPLSVFAPSRLRPQQPPDHLAGGGHRHLVDEGDLARIFVRRQMRAHELLDVVGERIRLRLRRTSAR